MDFFYIYTYEAAPREISVEDSLMHLKQKVSAFYMGKVMKGQHAMENKLINRMQLVAES